MKYYQYRVQIAIESFEAFSTKAIPKKLNSKVDSLVVFTSLLLPHPELKNKPYKIKLIYRPSVLDNVDHWKVFYDDKKIQAFIENVEAFSQVFFEGGDNEYKDFFFGKMGGLKDEIIMLKGKKYPRG